MKYSLILLILVISWIPRLANAVDYKIQKQMQKPHIVNNKVSRKITAVKKVNVVKTNKQNKLVGIASWYGYESVRSRVPKTANGELFLPSKMTAAHRTLPFGTKVKVTNLKNNKSVVVIINDRGPFVKGRIIDLSKGAAHTIGITGTQRVQIAIIS